LVQLSARNPVDWRPCVLPACLFYAFMPRA